MKVIVSTNITYRYEHYVVVPSVTEVLQLADVECVILHSYKDGDVLLATAVTEIRNRFNCRFFYISSQPKAVVNLILSGIQGVVIEDDFYYDDETELDALIESYSATSTALTTSTVTSSLAIVKDFVTAYARGEERCSLPYFIQQTNEAITELEQEIGKHEIQIREMGSSAIDVFKRASGYISKLDEQNREIAKQLENLTAVAPSQRRAFGVGGASFFPTVKYNPPPTKKVIVIREYSHCRYLTSFMLAYQSYLKTMKNKRVKLIFTVQKGRLIYQKYTSGLFTFIAQESVDNLSLYDKELIATNTPQSNIMQKILERGTYDVIFVVDRLFGGDVILTGNNVKQLSAVGGSSDLTRFKLNPKFCIFSHTGTPDAFLVIPAIGKYPPATAPEMRAAKYVHACSQMRLYEKMNRFLEIE